MSWMQRQIEKNIPGQLPMFPPSVDWQPTPVSKLPSWSGAKRIGIDVETKDEKLTTLGPGVRRGGEIVGISFKIEDGPGFYLPFGHPEDNLPKEHVLQYMKDQCKEYEGDFVGANLGYDLDYLLQADIRFPKVKRWLDIQVAEPLIDETRLSYSLESQCGIYNIPGKNERILRDAAEAHYVDPKKGLWQLPGRYAADYAVGDVEKPLIIMRRQERIMEERKLEGIFKLESELLPILVKMRRRGVLVDQKRLQFVEDWADQQRMKALEFIATNSGVRLGVEDINTPEAIEKVLRSVAKGFQFPTTAKGKTQLTAGVMRAIKHPVADAVIKARKMDKLINTFGNSVREHMVNGRIHATFNQLRRPGSDNGLDEGEGDDDKGVRYGRMSCTDPNLQQQPSKDDEYDFRKEKGLLEPGDFHLAKLWRSIYVPEPGCRWAALDYSGQEPRMIVHYAALMRCNGADAIVAAYLANPDLDLHQMTADIAGIKRKPAKIIFLGLAYGMGEVKLCISLGLKTVWIGPMEHLKIAEPTWRQISASKRAARCGQMMQIAGPEGAAILDRYNEMVPFVSELRKHCQNRAEDKGFITTILGRQLHFPERQNRQPGQSKYDWLHKALNRLIQGSAADQTKKAVVEMDRAGHELQLQVHDEIDLSVRDERHAEECADIMRTCVPLKVASKVDVELGDSWGDSM